MGEIEIHIKTSDMTYDKTFDAADREAAKEAQELVSFILGHAGAVAREHYVRLGHQYPNVYLELCFSACPRGLVEYFVGEGLAHKMLWGSDCIFMSMEQQIGRVIFAQISEGDKRLILGETAARVLLRRE